MEFYFKVSGADYTEILGYGGEVMFPGVRILKSWIPRPRTRNWVVHNNLRAEQYYSAPDLKAMTDAAHRYIDLLEVTERLTK
jgi:hypothetical protein